MDFIPTLATICGLLSPVISRSGQHVLLLILFLTSSRAGGSANSAESCRWQISAGCLACVSESGCCSLSQTPTFLPSSPDPPPSVGRRRRPWRGGRPHPSDLLDRGPCHQTSQDFISLSVKILEWDRHHYLFFHCPVLNRIVILEVLQKTKIFRNLWWKFDFFSLDLCSQNIRNYANLRKLSKHVLLFLVHTN